MGSAAIHARNADGDATAMRRVATELEVAVGPLRTVLDPIVARHGTATWEGRAAVASRLRLDRFHEQTAAAVRTVDNLISELRTTATRRETAADRHWDDYGYYARQAQGLEKLLAGGVSGPLR